MKNIPERALGRLRQFFVWVSPPTRLFAFLLVLAFLVSLGSWAIFDKNSGYLLYFPNAGGKSLQGELRYMPRRSGTEEKARGLVAEFLLGPANPNLLPAVPSGTALNGLLYRKGTLFVDIGEEAALIPGSDLRLALKALERTLRLGLHQVRHVVITIGGFQPWDEGLAQAMPTARKNREKN